MNKGRAISTVVRNRVRRGFYLDSVALMRIAGILGEREGVESAALMIGTPANRRMLAEAGLLAGEGEGATPGDLVIAVRATGSPAAEAALAQAEALLASRAVETGAGRAWRPRTLQGALESLPGANLALISLPGEFAVAEAHRALRSGLHVMLFSDHVSLEDERALKEEAREAGLLLMGPDCGTALLGGVPLAFANRVRRGPVGIVSASGTGLQEVATLIHRGGGGVSHGIGTGGRDLHEEVGGVTTLMALDALEADADTAHIVLLSKPPGAQVAGRIVRRLGESAKPCTVCFFGLEGMELPDNAALVPTLHAAAERALGATLGEADPPLPAGARPGALRGLFAGGTLCAEAQSLMLRAGLAVRSNVPVPGAGAAQAGKEPGHLLLDLGADEYTQGRPHPMIDPEPRLRLLRETLAEPGVGVILLDFILGTGAHPDPAGALVANLPRSAGERPVLVASVCGTDEDPQHRGRQARTLEGAGVLVSPSNARATALAIRIARGA